MSSLMEKLKAARQMQESIAEHSKKSQAELNAEVEPEPAMEEELGTGPAQTVNNQESPMAKLRKRQQEKQERLAEPKETKQATETLEQALTKSQATSSEKPQATPSEKPQATQEAKPQPKKSLKERLAEQRAARLAKAEPEQPEPEPAQEPEPEPEPTPSGSSLLARIRARHEAAKTTMDEGHETPSAQSVDESISAFQQTKLPTQPDTAADPEPPTGRTARVEVQETGIQGAPQVKQLEEEAVQSSVAQNRQAVTLNAKQEEVAERYASQEESCVLIGAAGTGKTTGVRGVLQRLLAEDKISYTADYKRQGGGGLKDRVKNQPDVAICAFTRRAAINIMESITSQDGLEEFKYCCQTVHNLLEYAPEYYDDYDDESGEWVQKMRFCPHRHAAEPIDCKWLIIEEASMVDLFLWESLRNALRPGTKILFLGDINQLPPVFGLPILVYAMHKLPTVELTEVYRQSIGPVLQNAHNILAGGTIEEAQAGDQAFYCYEEYKPEKGGVSLKRHSTDKGEPLMVGESKLSSIYTTMFRKLFEAGRYDPEQDMIISPFNVGDLGTLHMNQCLAQFIGDAREAVVHEVLAGFHKHYLAVGDKVMVERQDGYIKSIHHNTDYMGSLPKQSGYDLSRFGVRILGRNAEEVDLDEEGDVNFNLDAIAEKSAEELKRAASHIVTVELESGEERVLSTSGQFAPEKFTLGYCITGHKSQGSEWRSVYIIMHKKHHSLLTREWLYTTVTRAKKQCTLLCKPYSIEKAIASQRITGDTIEDKLAWFTSGAVDNLDEVEVTK